MYFVLNGEIDLEKFDRGEYESEILPLRHFSQLRNLAITHTQ